MLGKMAVESELVKGVVVSRLELPVDDALLPPMLDIVGETKSTYGDEVGLEWLVSCCVLGWCATVVERPLVVVSCAVVTASCDGGVDAELSTDCATERLDGDPNDACSRPLVDRVNSWSLVALPLLEVSDKLGLELVAGSDDRGTCCCCC